MACLVQWTSGCLSALACAALWLNACGGSSDTAIGPQPGADDGGLADSAAISDVRSADQPRGQCDPMDIMGADMQCTAATFNQFAWYGASCAPFGCTICAGADCGRLYITAAGCDDAHRACYGLAGITRNCAADSDCMVVPRQCCGCGTLDIDHLIGVRTSEAAAFNTSVCKGVGACTACVSTNDPAVHAMCVSGRCQAVAAP